MSVYTNPELPLSSDQVKRTIDVSTHLVKISSVATVRNEGDSVAQSMTFSTDPLLLKHLASVSANVKVGKKVVLNVWNDFLPKIISPSRLVNFPPFTLSRLRWSCLLLAVIKLFRCYLPSPEVTLP